MLFAICGVGWLIRRDLKSALDRLGLVKPTKRQIAMSVLFLAMMLLSNMAFELAMRLVQPETAAAADPTIEALGGVTLLMALLVSLGAGIGEETLFRGAMQPRLGIWLTSLVFAVSHIQYMNMPIAISALFTASLIFGWERKMLNTTCCIVTHISYDAVLFAAYIAAGM